ncbi:MAG TPA: tRNA pseudouridine(38-40) synthase TruA [Thermoanaerobaculia bacterium]
MRLLFTIQYLGTRYAGWQLQENAPSVQQHLEEALAATYNVALRVHGAGRTDAGVHARAMRAHVDVPFDIPVRGLILGLNNRLPADIRVTAVEPVADDFHARFDATRKTYEYRIWNAEVADVFAAATHAHVAQPLDVAVMHNAAQALLGQHDFAVFTVASPEVSTTVRTIASISVTREREAIRIVVTADGFLRYMVRRIAGSLIEIGRGKLDRALLLSSARWTAPAHGLTLLDIGYSQD